MRKTIVIDGKQVEIKANARTMLRYKEWLNRDMIKDFYKAVKPYQEAYTRAAEAGEDVLVDVSGEVIEILQSMTWVMARQADSSVPANVGDWLDRFDSFDVETVGKEVVDFWFATVKTSVTPKNV